MKKNLPFIIAALCLLLAFLLSFSAARSSRLKQLRAADDTAPANTQDAADTSSESASETQAPASQTEVTTELDTSPVIDVTGLSALPAPSIINMPTNASWNIVLINIFYQMNQTYEPMVASIAEGIVLDERVAEAYKTMEAAAAKDGVPLKPAVGYVSPDRQERLYQKAVDELTAAGMPADNARLKAAYTILPPRCSEANYGLSVDFAAEGDFAASPAYVWLRAHAAEYGFIERYTADKENVTHFKADPCHWRYVGADAAKYMREYNVSLEEYVGKTNQ